MAEQNQEQDRGAKGAGDGSAKATARQAPDDAKSDVEAARNPAKGKGEDAITLLKSDHRKVEQLFESYEKATRRAEKQKLAQQICQELIIHTTLEEEIFYPACRDHVDDDPLDEAQVEHDGAKVLINELMSGSPEQPYYDAKVKVLADMIKHHVDEEEKRSEGIFAKAKASGVDTEELAQRLTARKAELAEQAQQNGPERPRPRSFTINAMEPDMPQGQYRDRDERGRFTSEDDDYDRGGARSRGVRERDGRGRFMSEDDDDRSYGASRRSGYGAAYREGGYYDDEPRSLGRGQFRDRDERGRFMSEDDDDRSYSTRSRGGYGDWDDEADGRSYSSRSRGGSRDEDDDDRGGRSRGRGGWFGDSEGHSMAARQRGGSRFHDDDERSFSSRGGRERDEQGRFMSDDDDERSFSSRGGGRDRDERGRFVSDDDDYDARRSSRSQSMRTRRRDDDDDDDRGRGWFGDPQGHSEASRRGWESRDDGGGSRGQSARGNGGRRSRDDDDDRRSSSSSRGRSRSSQGGWFGDPRGHAEAARRGWENRQ
jgi:hemerythrin superfamily protein